MEAGKAFTWRAWILKLGYANSTGVFLSLRWLSRWKKKERMGRKRSNDSLRHGSNACDSSSPTERSSPVMLSAAKHLSADRDRPFAALRVTRCDCSNGQVLFFKIEPCLNKKI